MRLNFVFGCAFSALLSAASANKSGGKIDQGQPELLLTNKTAFKYERLEKNDTVLLIVDIQEGLINLARDWDVATYRNNYMAHSSLAKVFDLPVILTTSAETGMPSCSH